MLLRGYRYFKKRVEVWARNYLSHHHQSLTADNRWLSPKKMDWFAKGIKLRTRSCPQRWEHDLLSWEDVPVLPGGAFVPIVSAVENLQGPAHIPDSNPAGSVQKKLHSTL